MPSLKKKRLCASSGENVKPVCQKGQRLALTWPGLFVYSVGRHLDLFLIVDTDLKYAFVTVGEVVHYTARWKRSWQASLVYLEGWWRVCSIQCNVWACVQVLIALMEHSASLSVSHCCLNLLFLSHLTTLSFFLCLFVFLFPSCCSKRSLVLFIRLFVEELRPNICCPAQWGGVCLPFTLHSACCASFKTLLDPLRAEQSTQTRP